MNKYKIEEILSNIQFQVYSGMNFIEPLGLDKETWKELLEYINKQKEVLDKIKEHCIKEQARIVINNTEEDEFVYTELLQLIDKLLEEIE